MASCVTFSEFAMSRVLRGFLLLLWWGSLCGHAAEAPLPGAGAVSTSVQNRVLSLQGQTNFRDLGGYETHDGRRVRMGMIFRSGELSHLSAADYAQLSGLGIQTIYDLRDQGERASQPTAWAGGAYLSLASPKPAPHSSLSPFTDPQMDADRARAVLVAFYGQMPTLYAPEYRVIFYELLSGHAPLLVHCTAGKDRTGVASALILSALGVPQAAIIQDYELTNQLLNPATQSADTDFMRQLRALPTEVQQALMRADASYIAAAFQSIESQYGSVGGYLSSQLGVGPEQIKQLQARYLQ
jgi:protein-tyrosine phosphatase